MQQKPSRLLFALFSSALLVACGDGASDDDVSSSSTASSSGEVGGAGGSGGSAGGAGTGGSMASCNAATTTPAGGELVTHINSDPTGKVAVRVKLPQQPRYAKGAPVVVSINTFFTSTSGFSSAINATEIGAIDINYLWPGKSDMASGAASDGVYDYGGADSITALRDVVRYALGLVRDEDDCTLAERLAVTPLSDNVGLYAFSHPGIAATNVVSLHGASLPGLRYFVGRENPTADALSTVEVGHWQGNKPVYNPTYDYPSDYGKDALDLDYSKVEWRATSDPDCAKKGYDFVPAIIKGGSPDYVLGCRVPTMWDKRYYSVALTTALRDGGALSEASWPTDLATVEEAEAAWPFRSTPGKYDAIGQSLPDLRVMLVFAPDDHVQPALDKPHVHQAYDGFQDAGIWTRLNPDLAYAKWVDPSFGQGYPDTEANAESLDWASAFKLAYPKNKSANSLVPFAAVAEMADRTQTDNWSDNLDEVLVQATAPSAGK